MIKVIPVLAFLWGCVPVAPAFQEKTPETIFWNGNIYPAGGASSRVEALAVGKGRILAAGSNATVRALAGPSTRQVDLEGATVVPGLIDSHAHMAGLGALLCGRLDLVRARSFDEVVAAVRAEAARKKPGEWILGGRWDQARWGQSQYPTHERLSQAVPDHPVWLKRIDGHMGLANRKAMELAGVTKETPSPPGGEVLKGPGGEPNGLFVDNAMSLVARKMKAPGVPFGEAILAAQAACLKVGLTGVHDARVSPEHLRTYRRLADEGKLKLRVYAMVGGSERIPEWFANNPPIVGERLTVRSCKMVIDGAMGSRGAWMREPYSDRPVDDAGKPYCGFPVMPPDLIRRVTQEGLRHGYQICTHAIGDRANREVLQAYEAALRAVPVKDHRLRLEHAQCLVPEDIPRCVESGVIPSMQPVHATADMSWVLDRIGPERVKGAFAWAQFYRAGARIAAGSDFPVESENPLLGLYAAVTRQDAKGKPEGGWHPEERMTREEALRAFTINAAYAEFAEDRKGSLEPGKFADFSAFSGDIMTCEPKDLLATHCLMTVIGGEIVYRASRDGDERGF